MAELNIGDKAPDFKLQNHEGKEVSLTDYKGKWLVLYFYPRDNTPGCTIEAKAFTCLIDEFEKLNANVVGVSRDSVASHERFIEKQSLNLTLLSDPDREALEKYGAWQLKKLYGKESMGIVRSTFLIDPEGNVAHIWPKVKVKGHVEEVKTKLEELNTISS